MSRLTLDKVLCLILAISSVNDTLYDMEVELTLTLRFTCNHVLLEFLWVLSLAAVVIHIVLDGALVIVVQFTNALVGRCRLVVFPCRVVVCLVLPFDLTADENREHE